MATTPKGGAMPSGTAVSWAGSSATAGKPTTKAAPKKPTARASAPTVKRGSSPTGAPKKTPTPNNPTGGTLQAPARSAPSKGKSPRTAFENFEQRQKYNPTKVIAISPPTPGGWKGAAGLGAKIARRMLSPKTDKALLRKEAIDAYKALGKDNVRRNKPMGVPDDHAMAVMAFKSAIKRIAMKPKGVEKVLTRTWETAKRVSDAANRNKIPPTVGVGSAVAGKVVNTTQTRKQRGGGGGGMGW